MILLALIKEDVIESNEVVAVEVKGVFDMLDVALVAVETAAVAL